MNENSALRNFGFDIMTQHNESDCSISIPVRPSALRRALPFAAMFVGSIVLGFVVGACVFAATGSLLAGIIATGVIWIFVPIAGYKVVLKRQLAAERIGPYVLFEDGFLTIPRRGQSDLGLDLADFVLSAFVLEIWLRVYTKDDGTVVKSNLRKTFAVLQLQQPKKCVRFMAEPASLDSFANFPRMHRTPPIPIDCQLNTVDIWPDDLVKFLETLRSSGVNEIEPTVERR